jgi:hypothetical protein
MHILKTYCNESLGSLKTKEKRKGVVGKLGEGGGCDSQA